MALAVAANVAGDNAVGDMVGGAPATGDAISGACNLAADARGNLLVPLGTGVDVIAARVGTFYGKKMTAGHLYQIAGFPSQGSTVDVALGVAGSLLVTVNGEPQSHGNSPLGAHIYVIAGCRGIQAASHTSRSGPQGQHADCAIDPL